MREMSRQMQRAGWAGDPDGTIAAHGGPGRFSGERTEFRYQPPAETGDRRVSRRDTLPHCTRMTSTT
jgi:hypothetical protein